jgi:hypothetical protein
MDPIAVVDDKIDDGKQLVERLMQEGLGITAAFWAKTSEDAQWYLYLILPGVEEEGVRKSYRRINAVRRDMPQPSRLGLSDVKVIGTKHPLARAVASLQRRYPGDRPIRSGEAPLDWGVSLEGAYVYPASVLANGRGTNSTGARAGPSAKAAEDSE